MGEDAKTTSTITIKTKGNASTEVQKEAPSQHHEGAKPSQVASTSGAATSYVASAGISVVISTDSTHTSASFMHVAAGV